MNIQVLGWDVIELFAEHCAQAVRDWYVKPDCVYGIPRGGIIPAQLIARSLEIDLLPLGELECDTQGRRVLLVDDIIDSGTTIAHYVDKLEDACVGIVALTSKAGPTHFGGDEIPTYVPKAYRHDEWIVFPWEEQDATTDNTGHVRRILELLGEDPTREGLVDTPERFIKAMGEMTEGYHVDEKEIFKATFAAEDVDQLIVIPKIEFFSTCEHHLFPFYGHVYIGYIPKGRVLGLSKFARLVRMYSRRLQVQEIMTKQICDSITEHLNPVGVGVIVEAKHLCMAARGIESRDPTFVTSSLQGIVRDYARSEFLALAGLSGPSNGRR